MTSSINSNNSSNNNSSNNKQSASSLLYNPNMINRDEIKQQLPQYLHQYIPQHITPVTPYIKMKRLPQIDDSLLILTQYMSLNISFTSPLLQSIDFLQQYYKYKFRSILSSFPIPNTIFDTIYNQIQNNIMLKYKKNVTKIMKIVFEMINVANCQKINTMKIYYQIINNIKSQLLLNQKQTDPYLFQPQQFNHDKQHVKNILLFCQQFININNTETLPSNIQDKQKYKKQNQLFKLKSKLLIQQLTQKIKNKSISMMDQMNNCQVQYPYIPQNNNYDIIDVQKILISYYNKIKIKSIQIDESLQLRKYGIQRQINKLLQQGLKQYEQQSIIYSRQLIQTYNKQSKSFNHIHNLINNNNMFSNLSNNNLSNNNNNNINNNNKNQSILKQYKTSISSCLINMDKCRSIDVNDINNNMSRQYNSDMRRAIKNIKKQLTFDNSIRVHNLCNKQQKITQMNESIYNNNNYNNNYNNSIINNNNTNNNNIKIKNYNQNNIQNINLDIEYNSSINPYILKQNRKSSYFHNHIINNNNNINNNNHFDINDYQYQHNNLLIQQNISKHKSTTLYHKHKPKLTYSQQIKLLQTQFISHKKHIEENNKIQLTKNPSLSFNKNIYIHKNFIISSLFEHKQSHKHNSLLKKSSIDKSSPNNPFQKKKINYPSSTDKQNIPLNQKQSLHQYYIFKTQKQKILALNDNSLLSQEQIIRLQNQNQAFQNQRKIQYTRKLESLQFIYQMKNYQKFCSLSINPKTKKGGLDTKTYIDAQKIYRYGIQIYSKWQNYTIQKGHSHTKSQILTAFKLPHPIIQSLNKFFFYTFKQRYYRYSKNVQQNSQIPILMTLENQNQFLNEKMVKKIINLMKKFQFFILWTLNDIIVYEQKVQFGLRKAILTIFVFAASRKLSTGLIWQIRKRVDQTFKQQPQGSQKLTQNRQKKIIKVSKFILEQRIDYQFHEKNLFSQNKETINEILCKIECVHRIFYDRHKKQLTIDKTIQKGKQLWQQLIKWKN